MFRLFMKICWWTNYPTVNQTAIVNALRRQGADVVVCYFCHYDSYRKSLGWKEPQLGFGEFFARSISSARSQIEDFDDRVQMVPSFFNLTSWRVLIWSILHKRPWFAVTEASSGSKLTAPLQWIFSRLANRYAMRIFCIGNRALSQYARNGVASELLMPFAYATEVNVEKKSHNGDVCFVYSGALTKRKAVDLLAKAFERVREKVPNAKLKIVGDGVCRHYFESLDNVDMVGAVSPEAVPFAIADGDVIILPSRYDAWGVALVEGAALAMAMIASDKVGASELIENDKNGYIFKAGDVDGLTEAMMKYALDPVLAHKHGEAAKVAAIAANPDNLAATLIEGLSNTYTGAFDSLSQDGVGKMPKIEGGPKPIVGMVVADFWEEHCTECGAPQCYKTCQRFALAPNGRCKRFAHGIRKAYDADGKMGWEVEFLPWGKLELLFHGKATTARMAESIVSWAESRGALARRLESSISGFLPSGRTPCGILRSLRWRYVKKHSQISCAPNLWVIDCSAEAATTLLCEVRSVDGKVLFAQNISVPTAPISISVKLPLPFVEEGALFRIFTPNGEGTKKIWFMRNALVRTSTAANTVKCVAWDLDDTLWSGTLSEDGLEGLKLKNEVVDVIKALDARGIVNSICSKNDETAALDALRHFGIEEYFVFPQISWGCKSAALLKLLKEMNISQNALAFIDDRSENRCEVRERLPMVRVFKETDASALLSLPYFKPAENGSGSSRRISYREEMTRREEEKTFAGNTAAFLENSNIKLSYFDLASASNAEFKRCCELIGRANQLTMTGHRYSEEECRTLLTAPNTKGWGISCSDRYGVYGIIGVAIVSKHNDKWQIIEFVMSCRIAGKGCEIKALEWIRNILGGKPLAFNIVDTGLNRPLREAIAPLINQQKKDK